MTNFLVFVRHCPKNFIYQENRPNFKFIHSASYHVTCGVLLKKRLSKSSTQNSNHLHRHRNNLFGNIWQKHSVNLAVDSLKIQRRYFSIKETFETAVASHSSVFTAISESTVVQYAQNFVVNLHDITGFPWWLSIITVTFLVRCFITLPLSLYQSYVIARLENVRKEMDEIVNNLRYDIDREIRKNKLSERKARAHFRATVRKEYKRLVERDNCHPAKAAILAIIQIPTWVVFSTVFRNLVYMLPNQDAAAMVVRLSLSVGGLPWCTDLTVSDSLIIPIALGLTNLTIIEVQTMMHLGKKSRFSRYMTNFFRGFSIFMIPVAATVPSAVSLYWFTSSVFGLCQNLIVMSPRVRQMCNFPPTASFNPHPYTHLAQQIKSKFKS